MNIELLMYSVEKWVTKGDLNPEILSDDFVLSSPFWKKADKSADQAADKLFKL